MAAGGGRPRLTRFPPRRLVAAPGPGARLAYSLPGDALGGIEERPEDRDEGGREAARLDSAAPPLGPEEREHPGAARALTDEEVEAAIRRAVKQRKEAIEQYGRGGRADLVAAETEELAILEAYLPKAPDRRGARGGRARS